MRTIAFSVVITQGYGHREDYVGHYIVVLYHPKLIIVTYRQYAKTNHSSILRDLLHSLRV